MDGWSNIVNLLGVHCAKARKLASTVAPGCSDILRGVFVSDLWTGSIGQAANDRLVSFMWLPQWKKSFKKGPKATITPKQEMRLHPCDHHLLQVSSPSSSASRFLLCRRVAKWFGGRLFNAGLAGCWSDLSRFSLEPQYCSRMSWSDKTLSTGNTRCRFSPAMRPRTLKLASYRSWMKMKLCH